MLFTLPVNAVSTALFGNTLGKSLFGIRVAAPDAPAARLPLRAALRREAQVWWRGQALGLSIPMLIANIIAYHRLKSTGTAAWDSDLGLRVYSGRPPRGLILGLLLICLLIGLLALIGAMI